MGSGSFHLTDSFLSKYKRKKPPFGFNGLGELVYMRTYSRIKPNGDNEVWWETVQRVVEGTYNMQKDWIEQHSLGWSPWKAQASAQEMYDRIFNMKFLPPGRGLWAMGSPITTERGTYAALNNCAFVSTETLKEDGAKPFCFLMDMSMLGVGVGFDTKGAGQVHIKGPDERRSTELFKIPDSREGWVDSVRLLIESFFFGAAPVNFDYSLIREAGAPIKGFGGISSGPDPLKKAHSRIEQVLTALIGEPITITAITDIMNIIGDCVVAGNVRRTAEIVFGDPHSDEYLDLKNYEVNPQREQWGWTSNNSVLAELGMDYGDVCERIRNNGEPGLAWLENMQAYSRMSGIRDYKDKRATGGNPCLEQTLESYELCCLVENFPDRHESLEDFNKTLKYSYLYAKTVTLAKTHWPETNRVLLRNRRIGCSVSGVAQFLSKNSLHELKTWLTEGYKSIGYYDEVYSDWLAVPRSIKRTSVKPSGSVSLLAGSTAGMHYPESRYWIKRLRLAATSKLVKPLEQAGYDIEPAVDGDNTLVVSCPVDCGEGVRALPSVSMWEQFNLAAFLQKYWADNQVSCTVTFDPETEGKDLHHALNFYQYQLKGISILPRVEDGAFPQMPQEAIDEKTYKKMVSKLKPLKFGRIKGEKAEIERFCNNDTCQI